LSNHASTVIFCAFEAMTKMNVLGRKTGRDDHKSGAVNGDMRRTVRLFAERIERRAAMCARPASVAGG
jgi:hypothetical protein